jgi:hypothetical protein
MMKKEEVEDVMTLLFKNDRKVHGVVQCAMVLQVTNLDSR